jgi:hypothetical protein
VLVAAGDGPTGHSICSRIRRSTSRSGAGVRRGRRAARPGRPREGHPRPDPALRDAGRAPRAGRLVPTTASRPDRHLMAIEVAIESTIDAPSDEVFETIADLEAWPTWLIASGIRSVARASDDPCRSANAWSSSRMLRTCGPVRGGGHRSRARSSPGPPRPRRGRRDHRHRRDHGPRGWRSRSATELRWTVRIGLPLRYRVFESMARPAGPAGGVARHRGLRIALERPAQD